MAHAVFALLAVLSLAAAGVQADTAGNNVIAKVLSMIGDLETKLIAEGEEGQKIYAEFAEFCSDRSRELAFEIKTGSANKEELSATIEKATSDIDSLATKIDELAGDIAEDEGELKKATDVRNKERADFVKEDAELKDTLDTLQRAIGIIEKEMAGGASLAQLKNANGITQALTVLVQASALSSADSSRLTSLMQSSTQDEDSETGGPAAAAYESQSGGIVDTLENLLEKATAQLEEARKKEDTAANNFAMSAQALKDEVKYATKDKDAAAKGSAEAAESKATAEGDLSVTTKDLAADIASKEDLHNECMMKANDFETEAKELGEELKALATAKKIISEATSLAQTTSFLQVVSSGTAANRGHALVKYMKSFAQKEHSATLAQLASRVASAIRFGAAAGEDPFAKVKTLITDMVAKLQKEAAEGADKKAYCDKEMAETTAKKEDKSAEVEKLTTKIDSAAANSAKVKEEVAALQKELAALAAQTSELTTIRGEEKAAYDASHAELKKGLDGIKLALKVLRDYYSGKAAPNGIMGLLEVAESDLAKGLSEIETVENAAVAEYDAFVKEGTMTKLTKDQDVKYKSKEAGSLDKTLVELKGDRDGVQDELDAVLEYDGKIKEQCIAKADSYESIKARREAEIAGLKEALNILEGESALVQTRVAHHTLRGAQLRAA